MSRATRFVVPMSCLLLLSLVTLRPATAAATSVTLQWTAPGDDGNAGRATRYEIRYWPNVLTAANFMFARAATGVPAPKPAGGQETYVLTGLSSDLTYCIALRSMDEAGNWSAMSNVVYRGSHTLAVGDDSSATSFALPWPNPAQRSVNLSFVLSRAGDTRIAIFDIAGRRVRFLDQGVRGPGTVPSAWDLRDEQGHRVSPGAYIVLAHALGRQWTRRVVVMD